MWIWIFIGVVIFVLMGIGINMYNAYQDKKRQYEHVKKNGGYKE